MQHHKTRSKGTRKSAEDLVIPALLPAVHRFPIGFLFLVSYILGTMESSGACEERTVIIGMDAHNAVIMLFCFTQFAKYYYYYITKQLVFSCLFTKVRLKVTFIGIIISLISSDVLSHKYMMLVQIMARIGSKPASRRTNVREFGSQQSSAVLAKASLCLA